MRRLALGVLGAAPLALIAASFADARWAAAVAALAASSLPPAVILLAVGDRDRIARWAAVALWLLLAGAWLAALALAPGQAGVRAEPYPAGLPWAGWLLLGGLAVVPLVLLGWAHAAGYRPPEERG